MPPPRPLATGQIDSGECFDHKPSRVFAQFRFPSCNGIALEWRGARTGESELSGGDWPGSGKPSPLVNYNCATLIGLGDDPPTFLDHSANLAAAEPRSFSILITQSSRFRTMPLFPTGTGPSGLRAATSPSSAPEGTPKVFPSTGLHSHLNTPA